MEELWAVRPHIETCQGGGCGDRGRGVEWDEDTNLLVENNERERAELEALRP